MELFDLYTAEREKTGRTMVRGEPVPDGYYRLVVHVCIFDPEGRMLIQQRQPFKEGWSDLWDISVGGSAVAGDSSRSAAERETREELGAVDPASLRLQYEEVQAARWASREEILQMIDDGRFIPYEKSLIDLLFFRRNHRSAHTRGDWTRGRG